MTETRAPFNGKKKEPIGVFVRFPLSGDQAYVFLKESNAAWDECNGSSDCLARTSGLLAIGTPVAGGELEVVAYDNLASGHLSRVKPVGPNVNLVRQSDALAKLAEKDAEIARLQAKQPLYDRMVQENGELKRAVAHLQRPEFYGTESQDTGSEDISSLFDFCKDNEVIEINGYRCVSTQFGFFDGTDVHLYDSEDEALSAAKAPGGPEA